MWCLISHKCCLKQCSLLKMSSKDMGVYKLSIFRLYFKNGVLQNQCVVDRDDKYKLIKLVFH